jgi:hypothetical protein
MEIHESDLLTDGYKITFMVLRSSLCTTYEASKHSKHILKDVNIHKDFVTTNLKSYEHVHKFNSGTKRSQAVYIDLL